MFLTSLNGCNAALNLNYFALQKKNLFFFRLHNLVVSRQKDKENSAILEKKLQEERKSKSVIEQQLATERKAKKAEEAAAARAVAIANATR